MVAESILLPLSSSRISALFLLPFSFTSNVAFLSLPLPRMGRCTQVSQEMMSANDTIRYVGKGDGEGDTEHSEDFDNDGDNYDED